jgi:hypothetical protein|tara:strand:- start:1700 stop:2281 length:582 start_codon:yes stop_codon:yes gene_type:complete
MSLYRAKTVIGIVVLFTAYAVLRYNIFGDVDVQNIPVYILNKSLSMSAALFLLLAGWSHWQKDKQASKAWGTYSLHFAMVHVVISLMLLSSAYYPKLFDGELMNVKGELSTLFGALAVYLYVLLSKHGLVKSTFHRIQFLATVVIALHLFFMGYSGWFTVGSWFGGLPPISLLSFIAVAVGGILYLRVLLRKD